MAIIIAATVTTLVLSLIFMKTRKTDAAQLTQPRAPIPTLGVQIICGDCSGDNELPVKTYLDASGNCHQCGGHSYMLASSLALNALQLRAERVAAYAAASGNGRVLAFETPASRANRAEKIAV